MVREVLSKLWNSDTAIAARLGISNGDLRMLQQTEFHAFQIRLEKPLGFRAKRNIVRTIVSEIYQTQRGLRQSATHS